MKVSPLISRRITEARLGPYDEGFFLNTVNSYYPSTIFVKSSNIVVSQVPEYATEINCYMSIYFLKISLIGGSMAETRRP